MFLELAGVVRGRAARLASEGVGLESAKRWGVDDGASLERLTGASLETSARVGVARADKKRTARVSRFTRRTLSEVGVRCKRGEKGGEGAAAGVEGGGAGEGGGRDTICK